MLLLNHVKGIDHLSTLTPTVKLTKPIVYC